MNANILTKKRTDFEQKEAASEVGICCCSKLGSKNTGSAACRWPESMRLCMCADVFNCCPAGSSC